MRASTETPIGLFCLGIVLVLGLTASAPVVAGDDPNDCDAPGDYPDVIVGNLHQVNNYNSIGGISAFAIGTVSCNIGTCWLDWFSGGSNLHPVIGQNMFRLKDGRFEHLGQSWLKHGFTALDQNFCSDDCIDTTGSHLGVLCSDPYSANLNGSQSNLGPKFEVDANSGFHPHPVTDIGNTGNAIFKRLQVHDTDLDPDFNTGALYFIEGHYVTQDDAAAGMQNNNASYRKVFVNGSSPPFSLSFDGPTQQQLPGIQAWQDYDTDVDLLNIQVPGEGLFILGTKVTDIGGGWWHYEYALHNLNSHRSAGSFSVPYPTGVTLDNIEFHDVDYHSGEPFDLTDWSHNGGLGGEMAWSTTDFSVNPNANALRWGTLYNFRFDAMAPPEFGEITIGLFRPGVPIDVTATVLVPTVCNGNSSCDVAENQCNCAVDCGDPPVFEDSCSDTIDNDCDIDIDCGDTDCCGDPFCSVDSDSDAHFGCLDCDDANGDTWSRPGDTSQLLMAKDGNGDSVLSWGPPGDPGANFVTYEVLRAREPAEFNGATCLIPVNPAGTTFTDTDPPEPMYSYLIRAVNECPGEEGKGSIGAGTSGGPRKGPSCN